MPHSIHKQPNQPSHTTHIQHQSNMCVSRSYTQRIYTVRIYPYKRIVWCFAFFMLRLYCQINIKLAALVYFYFDTTKTKRTHQFKCLSNSSWQSFNVNSEENCSILKMKSHVFEYIYCVCHCLCVKK